MSVSTSKAVTYPAGQYERKYFQSCDLPGGSV